jgi:hypothetical protein
MSVDKFLSIVTVSVALILLEIYFMPLTDERETELWRDYEDWLCLTRTGSAD